MFTLLLYIINTISLIIDIPVFILSEVITGDWRYNSFLKKDKHNLSLLNYIKRELKEHYKN